MLFLILTVLFLPFGCASAKLLAMRATTTAVVESVGIRRGGHGTSAPKIDFSYMVDGRRCVSDQFSPGFFSSGTWSGGGRAARDYYVGQNVLVHYDPRHPDEACLAYGWHSWSIGLPLFLVGLGLQGWGSRRGGRPGAVAHVVGWTLFPLAVACFVLVQDVLRPSDLPTAAAIAAAVLAANLLYRALKPRKS